MTTDPVWENPPGAAQEPPADAAPTTAAPGGHTAVLGRARLAVDGDLWTPHERHPDWWVHGIYRMTGEQLDTDRGPVREVLLVDRAAAQVLAAAREWHDVWSWLGEVVGDQQPEAAPEPAGDGPGWDRESITTLIERLRGGLSTEQVWADQVEALLDTADELPVVSANRDGALDGLHAVRAELAEVTADRDRLRELAADSIDPATVPEQQTKNWTDWHPEAYCHRCGHRNISWYADSAVWNEVHGGSGPIWCPVCFATAYEQTTGRRISWRLAPADTSDEVAHLIQSEAHMRHERDAARAELAEVSNKLSAARAGAVEDAAEIDRLAEQVERLQADPRAVLDDHELCSQQLRAARADLERVRNAMSAAAQSAMDSAAYAEQGWTEVERLRAELAEVRQLASRWKGQADALTEALAEVTADRDRLAELVEGADQEPNSNVLVAADVVCDKLGTEDAQVVRTLIRHVQSLARRCAVRFEEAQRLRAERDRLRNTIAAAGRSARESAEYAQQGWAEVERQRALLARCVWIDPRRQSGQPCLGGTRIPAATIAGLLRDGMDAEQVRGMYPDVTDGHVDAVRAWAVLGQEGGGEPAQADREETDGG